MIDTHRGRLTNYHSLLQQTERFDGWGASNRARENLIGLRGTQLEYAAEVDALRAVAREVAEDVPSARRRLAGLDGRAADAGFRINGDTSVHDRRPDDDESGRAEGKGDLEFQARDVLRLVRDIDSDAAGRLRAISSSKRSWGIMNPSLGERPPLGPDASDILFRLGEERGGLDLSGASRGGVRRADRRLVGGV